MNTEHSTNEATSEESARQLANFAEKNRQAADRSELLAPVPSFVERGGVYLISGAVLLTLALLYYGQVHVVVKAKGVVVPRGDVRRIEALQGGVVKSVLARVGDRLPAGATILDLDVSESGIDLALQKRKQALDETQLEALRSTVTQLGRILADPNAQASASGSLIVPEAAAAVNALQTAQVRLEAARRDLASLPERRQMQIRQTDLIRQRLDLLQKNQKSGASFLKAQDATLEEKRKQLVNYRRLASNQLISPVELGGEEEKFRAAELAGMSLHQQYDDREVEIANQTLLLAETTTKLQHLDTDTQAGLRSAQLSHQQALAAIRQQKDLIAARAQEMDSNLQAMRNKIEQGDRRMKLASITMPVAGILAELKTKNVGELVASASIVATIVPEGVPLIVNAEVLNKDIGFVKPGLEAQVKVDAYPYEQFGTVRGIVETVLPPLGGGNFLITLRLSSDRLNANGKEVLLFPGLTVEAGLLTAKQRLLDLLLSSETGGKKAAK